MRASHAASAAAGPVCVFSNTSSTSGCVVSAGNLAKQAYTESLVAPPAFCA